MNAHEQINFHRLLGDLEPYDIIWHINRHGVLQLISATPLPPELSSRIVEMESYFAGEWVRYIAHRDHGIELE